jgi:hypothetical protein
MIDSLGSKWETALVGGECTAVVDEKHACVKGILFAKHNVDIAAEY